MPEGTRNRNSVDQGRTLTTEGSTQRAQTKPLQTKGKDKWRQTRESDRPAAHSRKSRTTKLTDFWLAKDG